MINKKQIIIGGIAFGIAVGGIALAPNDAAITLDNPVVIDWKKPTDDNEWKKESQKDSFDIRSDDVLIKMKNDAIDKLMKIENSLEYKTVTEHADYVRFQIAHDNPKLTPEEVEARYQERLTNSLYDVENLKQNIETMDHEFNLRNK